MARSAGARFALVAAIVALRQASGVRDSFRADSVATEVQASEGFAFNVTIVKSSPEQPWGISYESTTAGYSLQITEVSTGGAVDEYNAKRENDDHGIRKEVKVGDLITRVNTVGSQHLGETAVKMDEEIKKNAATMAMCLHRPYDSQDRSAGGGAVGGPVSSGGEASERKACPDSVLVKGDTLPEWVPGAYGRTEEQPEGTCPKRPVYRSSKPIESRHRYIYYWVEWNRWVIGYGTDPTRKGAKIGAKSYAYEVPGMTISAPLCPNEVDTTWWLEPTSSREHWRKSPTLIVLEDREHLPQPQPPRTTTTTTTRREPAARINVATTAAVGAECPMFIQVRGSTTGVDGDYTRSSEVRNDRVTYDRTSGTFAIQFSGTKGCWAFVNKAKGIYTVTARYKGRPACPSDVFGWMEISGKWWTSSPIKLNPKDVTCDNFSGSQCKKAPGTVQESKIKMLSTEGLMREEDCKELCERQRAASEFSCCRHTSSGCEMHTNSVADPATTDDGRHRSATCQATSGSVTESPQANSVEFVDKHRDLVRFSLEGGQLIKHVNDAKKCGSDDRTGVVTKLKYDAASGRISDQHGWGGVPDNVDIEQVLQQLALLAQKARVKLSFPTQEHTRAQLPPASATRREQEERPRAQHPPTATTTRRTEGEARALTFRDFEGTGFTLEEMQQPQIQQALPKIKKVKAMGFEADKVNEIFRRNPKMSVEEAVGKLIAKL